MRSAGTSTDMHLSSYEEVVPTKNALRSELVPRMTPLAQRFSFGSLIQTVSPLSSDIEEEEKKTFERKWNFEGK